jgi:hypothetical protein
MGLRSLSPVLEVGMATVRVALILFVAIMVAFILAGVLLTHFRFFAILGLFGLFAYVVYALVTTRRST